MKLLSLTLGIRITDQEEEAGIDAVSFGVNAYNNE